MGLIKEPREIDFTVLSKVWTEEEEKEFSELIKKQKEERSKQKVHLPRKYPVKHVLPSSVGLT
ncbi:MAG: hypothetical protein FWF53_10190 [Candidatus Azobacteroides sp.]|nr:hypothetical protein [Candidatus Azobacteroides sp.]